MWQFENLGGNLEAISAALFTRVLGWTKGETDIMLAQVRKDLKNVKYHSYWDV
jgi:hypothetical protein